MKINVEFDLTPEELRRSLGLPDVEAFQNELLERIKKRMESGAEGYDPMSLMQPFLQHGMPQALSQGMASFGVYQQMMLDMLKGATSSAAADESADTAAGDSEDAERAAEPGSKKPGSEDSASTNSPAGSQAPEQVRSSRKK